MGKGLKMRDTVYFSWRKVEQLLVTFCDAISKKGIKFNGVYGLPRGGLCPAVMISHRLHLPLLAAPAKGCLVVDDIADSGKTLQPYIDKQYFLMVLVVKYKSSVLPDYAGWHPKARQSREEDAWIVFPWEELR